MGCLMFRFEGEQQCHWFMHASRRPGIGCYIVNRQTGERHVRNRAAVLLLVWRGTVMTVSN